MKKERQIPPFMEKYLHRKLRIGFSGGADSTALLLLLLKWNWRSDELETVHFEHGLRGREGVEDALWCEKFCQERQIKFTLVRLDLSRGLSRGESTEDAARRARLDWYIENDDGSPIVLAHHGDDADENIFLKLARGGNVSSLASLQFERKLGALTVLRPLLDWRKPELEALLTAEKITDWRLDRSNEQNDYHRNFLRNVLLKEWAEYYPPLKKSLLRSRSMLAADADFIEQCAAGKIAEITDEKGELQLTTEAAFWRSLHPALLVRLLRAYIAGVSGQGDFCLTQSQSNVICRILEQLPGGRKRLIELGKYGFWEAVNDKLYWRQAGSLPASGPLLWSWRENRSIDFHSRSLSADLLPGAVYGQEDGCFYFDADKMPSELFLSARLGGEVMAVWGGGSPRRVKHLLASVPDKEDIFLLQDADGEIYLLGDLRRSIHAPVTEDTLCTLKLTVRKKTER